MKNDDKLVSVRWDLTPLYSSIDDTKITNDINKVKKIANDLLKNCKGKLNTKLAVFISSFIELNQIVDTTISFFFLMSSRDATNQNIKKNMSVAMENMSKSIAGLSFFDIELSKMRESDYNAQIKKSPILLKNKPMMDKIRKNAKFLLSEEVETILTKMSPFGSGEWDDMMDEMETKLSFKLGRKKLSIAEILHITNTSHNAKLRAKALKELDEKLASSSYAILRARALNIVMGEKALMDTERGFKSHMEARNISNNLDPKTVEALHTSVLKYGSVQGKRYYSILKRVLKKKTLSWADRNAPIPFESKAYISWENGVDIVKKAYGKFSPTLLKLIQESFDKHMVDAPVYEGKNSGAYNCTIVSKGGKVYTWTLLNYMGSTRDVATLAHELGHSVHGQLAGKEQGVLQSNAPMAYAETASIFGEMLTFEHMLSTIKDKKEKLSLLLNKANDWINSVNRQISFSLFEQKIHTKRNEGKLAVDDFADAWIEVTKQMYGEDGEIFKYENMENLWAYVGHFMRPFYVYAYAFGELFTQSLFAMKDNNPKNFEKLYLDMLKSGSTKNAVDLMKPFGLNPTTPDFWKKGIDISIKKWLDEAEVILKELKIK